MLWTRSKFILKRGFRFLEGIPRFRRMHITTISASKEFNALTKSLFPPLTFEAHKGQSGRVLVIGGSLEYTGAPFFAAISTLKLGADLVHVFCPRDAGRVIKSYSPELIVHPLLDVAERSRELEGWLARMHAVVVGPGLGENEAVLSTVKALVTKVQSMKLPLIIDADGLRLVLKDPGLIKGHQNTIITPNAIEFNRITAALGMESKNDSRPETEQLAKLLGNVTVIRKGVDDVISDGNNTITCNTGGSPRRCGGQGDVLAGFAGTLAHWALQNKNNNNDLYKKLGGVVSAACVACLLTRQCSHHAFKLRARSMITTDVIECIPNVVAEFNK